MVEKMKSFYKELEKAKRTIIKNLWIQKGMLDDEWFRDRISTKDYVVRDEEIKKRIRSLEGCLIQIKEKEIKQKEKQQNF